MNAGEICNREVVVASLESIKLNAWAGYEPEPARIAASRFLMIDRWQLLRYR